MVIDEANGEGGNKGAHTLLGNAEREREGERVRIVGSREREGRAGRGQREGQMRETGRKEKGGRSEGGEEEEGLG